MLLPNIYLETVGLSFEYFWTEIISAADNSSRIRSISFEIPKSSTLMWLSSVKCFYELLII